MIGWAETPAPRLRALADEGGVALWPIGATEQHGDHLATGFDLVAATEVCERAGRSLSKVVLLPGLAVGSSSHWLPLGATLSLRPETLAAVIVDVVSSVAASGFGRVVIVNGHAGNIGPAAAALGGLARSSTMVELVSYWDLVDPGLRATSSRTDGGGIGHAGELETSIAVYLGQGLLDEAADRRPGLALGAAPGSLNAPFIRPPRPMEESPSGVYGDPTQARAELGRMVIEHAADALRDHLRAVLGEAVR